MFLRFVSVARRAVARFCARCDYPQLPYSQLGTTVRLITRLLSFRTAQIGLDRRRCAWVEQLTNSFIFTFVNFTGQEGFCGTIVVSYSICWTLVRALRFSNYQKTEPAGSILIVLICISCEKNMHFEVIL